MEFGCFCAVVIVVEACPFDQCRKYPCATLREKEKAMLRMYSADAACCLLQLVVYTHGMFEPGLGMEIREIYHFCAACFFCCCYVRNGVKRVLSFDCSICGTRDVAAWPSGGFCLSAHVLFRREWMMNSHVDNRRAAKHGPVLYVEDQKCSSSLPF